MADKMVVTDISICGVKPNKIAVSPLGDRLYSVVNERLNISVQTNEGCFIVSFFEGFKSNFRSGGRFVDGVVDQFGCTQAIQAMWLFHDAMYTPCEDCNGRHPVSRELADKILRAGLIYAFMDAGESEKSAAFKAGLVYYSVRLFGGSAYKDDDELTESNKGLFRFWWCA